MAIGYFSDKAHKPIDEELYAALGLALPQWESLLSFIAEKFMIPPELSFGGKNYGWNLWYRKSGKSLVSLYPQKDCFVVQIVLGKSLVSKALSLDLGENVGGVLRSTPQLHDGRWMFITVRSDRDVDDIHRLLTLKRKPVKQKLSLRKKLTSKKIRRRSNNDLDIWQEFVVWLKIGGLDNSRVSPYYESLREPLWRFIGTLRSKALQSELDTIPEYYRVGEQVHYLLPLTLDGHRETYCFTFSLTDGQWAFQHIETLTIRADQVGSLPCDRFPDLPENKKAWMRAEIEISAQVRLFNFLVEDKGRQFAFDWFKDGAGYALAARTWVPFVPPAQAFIYYLCWEQANLRGGKVILQKLDDREAVVALEPLYFKLYHAAPHLYQQIEIVDYRRMFELIWFDRASAAGWQVEIGYSGETCLFRFIQPEA